MSFANIHLSGDAAQPTSDSAVIQNPEQFRDPRWPELKVVITGTFPDRLNSNQVIRDYMAEGFADVLGKTAVSNVPIEIAAHTIRQQRPGVVFAMGSLVPDGAELWTIRRACDECNSQLVIWVHDDPYEFDYAYKAVLSADVIFTNDRGCVPYYSRDRVYHLPTAASASQHYRNLFPYCDRQIDLLFCGYAYPNRIDFMLRCAPILSQYRTMILGDNWPVSLACAENKRVSNTQLSHLYSRARFTLNIGRHHSIANRRLELVPTTPGPRTFEAAMAGTVQLLVAESLEVVDYFEIGKEILLIDELTDLKRFLHDSDDTLLEQIAQASQARALRDHTYHKRAELVLETVLPFRNGEPRGSGTGTPELV